MVVHMMVASKMPEMAMTEEEAVAESTAICNYLKHTKIKIDPKTEAFYTMLTTIGMIEGTRLIAFARRKAAERASQNRDPNSNVVSIDPANPLWQPPMSH
jgi:hypothetical protein